MRLRKVAAEVVGRQSTLAKLEGTGEDVTPVLFLALQGKTTIPTSEGPVSRVQWRPSVHLNMT